MILASKIKKSKDFLQIFGMWKYFLDILWNPDKIWWKSSRKFQITSSKFSRHQILSEFHRMSRKCFHIPKIWRKSLDFLILRAKIIYFSVLKSFHFQKCIFNFCFHFHRAAASGDMSGPISRRLRLPTSAPCLSFCSPRWLPAMHFSLGKRSLLKY